MLLVSGWELCPHQEQALSPSNVLADREWNLKELDQQHLCQQSHLAFLALDGVPRVWGGGIEMPVQEASPWKDTREVGREQRAGMNDTASLTRINNSGV